MIKGYFHKLFTIKFERLGSTYIDRPVMSCEAIRGMTCKGKTHAPRRIRALPKNLRTLAIYLLIYFLNKVTTINIHVYKEMKNRIKQSSNLTLRDSRSSLHLQTSSVAVIHPSTSLSPLNPWFITGFSDGESALVISIHKNAKLRVG